MIKGKQKITNTIFFLSLILGSIFLIIKNKDSQDLPIFIIFGASVIYLTWALIFHKIDKSLTLGILIEYLLTAMLGLILLMGVII